jgi:hypothetical protein
MLRTAVPGFSTIVETYYFSFSDLLDDVFGDFKYRVRLKLKLRLGLG